MRNTCLYILFGLLFSISGFAQQIKTDVVVWGNGPAALAAGIQSARSGVKTLVIMGDEKLIFSPLADLVSTNHSPSLQSGIWAEFARKYSRTKEVNGKLPNRLNLSSDSAAVVLKAISDTVKRLSQIKNVSISEIKRSGKGWQLRLKNGQKVKTSLLVDASSNHQLSKQLTLKLNDTISTKIDWRQTGFRTSLAVLDPATILPPQALIPEKTENVVVIPSIESPVSAMHAGQAGGAVAAYCTFFKTNTKNLNVRLIQSELLTYQSALIPFGDILPSDSNFVKIQHIALSGLMNAGMIEKEGVFYFMPHNTVSTEELKLPMKTFYSRSQIWLADHPSEKLTIEETINLIMYTATRGEELRREVERAWKDSFGFKSEYEPKRAITRWEFAILLDAYLQPFNSQVDLQGHLVN
ncbi:MAG: FAD-dependent oxidoreductase [Sphingobacteriaceae bacterium]